MTLINYSNNNSVRSELQLDQESEYLINIHRNQIQSFNTNQE